MMRTVALIIAGIFVACPVFGESKPAIEEEMAELRHRLETLEGQLREKPDETVSGVVQEAKNFLAENGLSFSGLVELEAAYFDQPGENESDLSLATFELGLEAALAENLTVQAAILWEEDETEPLDLDTAFLTFDEAAGRPLSISAGKLYVPYSNFETIGIADPLTLDLGETRETAVLAQLHNNIALLNVAVFNGDVGKSQIDNAMARIDIQAAEYLTVGAYGITDIRESDTLEGIVDLNINDRKISGAGLFVDLDLARFQLNGEYVQANRTFEAGVLGADAVRPYAWALNAGYLLRDDLEVGVRYERSEGIEDLAETRYGGGLSYSLMENVILSGEYLQETFTDDSDVGTATAQLALEF